MFDYFYGLDWEKNPVAKKYLAGVLGKAETLSPELIAPLIEKYPRLKSVKAQPSIHFSVNWTGASSYTHGMTSAFVLGAHEVATYRGGTPLRRYGSMLIGSRSNGRPLGATQQGYSWVRVPGNTMPALTDEEWKNKLVSKNIATPPSEVDFGVHIAPGNGSLTFNETDAEFGRYGNFALKIDEPEESRWGKYAVSNFKGHKSYHFYKDKIVCLGSDYQADTTRSMRTILLQEMVNDIPWSHRDRQRWNPEKREIVINGEKKDGPFRMDLDLAEPNYIISPYGHAWVLSGGQRGSLQVQWAKQETFHKYRFNKSGGIGPGEEMTQGTAVIASLEQKAKTSSSHHYCVLLNSDGKSSEELEAYAKQTLAQPGYRVIKQDAAAHAVLFSEPNQQRLFSCLVFQPNTPLNMPLVKTTSRRVNLMAQLNEAGNLIVSVCDPNVDLTKEHGYPNISVDKVTAASMKGSEISKYREVQIEFSRKIALIASASGLPEANPPLNAKVIGDEQNILSFKTSNGVTDTFVIKLDTSDK